MKLLEAFCRVAGLARTEQALSVALMAFIVVCMVLCGAGDSINPLTLK